MNEQKEQNTGSSSKWKTLFYLSFFLGVFGVDRFYVGKVGSGIFKLLTMGGLGIWWFADLLVIALGKSTDVSGKFVEKQGQKAIKHIGICCAIAIPLFIIVTMIGRVSTVELSDSQSTKEAKTISAELDASKLFDDYNDNEIAADAKYKGEWIKVSGTIGRIEQGIVREPYIALETGLGEEGVEVVFDKANVGQLVKLTRGQRVTVIGKCTGKVLGIVFVQLK